MNTIKRYVDDKTVSKENYLSMNGDFVGRIIGFFVYETSFVKSNRNPSHIPEKSKDSACESGFRRANNTNKCA